MPPSCSALYIRSIAFSRFSREAAYDILRQPGDPNASPGTTATSAFSNRYLPSMFITGDDIGSGAGSGAFVLMKSSKLELQHSVVNSPAAMLHLTIRLRNCANSVLEFKA